MDLKQDWNARLVFFFANIVEGETEAGLESQSRTREPWQIQLLSMDEFLVQFLSSQLEASVDGELLFKFNVFFYVSAVNNKS